jgi:hypothetical protein
MAASGEPVMRRPLAMLLLFVPVFASAQPAEGRWEGVIHIPGRELSVVVDLAKAGGAWSGSLIVPTLGIKGAPLANIVVDDCDVAFDVGASLRGPNDAPASFKAHVGGATMAGRFTQGGNVARFELTRVGAAQVEPPLRSTRVRREIEGDWSGEFELGYARRVSLRFDNGADAATAKLVIVGKRTTELPVDFVSDEGDFVRIESHAARVTFEGRFIKDANEIRGAVELGPFELPLVLRRAR